jgi:ATP adenylyltransferase
LQGELTATGIPSPSPVITGAKDKAMTQSSLWAPWRISYILDKKDGEVSSDVAKGCLFCRLPQEGEDRENLILKRTRYSYVMLNRYPYSSGHLLVLPLKHAADLNELEQESYLDLMLLLKESIGHLQTAMQPAGINAGINMGEAAGAGIAAHLHFHIVPRWPGDHNFMPVIADTMVIPQHLDSAYEMLKPYFD